jgi:hypothetical protein
MRAGGLNRAQRLIIVVGLGLVLYFFGGWVTTRGGGTFGWVAYAPLSDTYNTPVGPGGFHPWVRLVIWVALILVWVVTSLWLLRSSSESTGNDPTENH